MKLWCDYTNHRGERRWREIVSLYGTDMRQHYPPNDPKGSRQPCMFVKLGDRNEPRTLSFKSCHEFLWLDDGVTPGPYIEALRVSRDTADKFQVQLIEEREKVELLTENLAQVKGWLAEEKKTSEGLDAALQSVQETVNGALGSATVPVRSAGEPDALAGFGMSRKTAKSATLAMSYAASPSNTNLSLDALRLANVRRQVYWDANGDLTGNLGILYKANEMAGEVGEACNAIKKLVRERLGIPGSRTDMTAVADELADVVICVDLLAHALDLSSLSIIIRNKFNMTSEKNALPVHLYGDSVYEGDKRIG